LEIKKTICQMGNHAYCACGLDVYVRDGKIIRVKGTKDNPTNRGTLCPKALAIPQLEYNPARLKYPLKRTGERGEGKWQRVSWDEAFDILVSTLGKLKERHGPESLYFHQGGGAGWETIKDFIERFLSAYGSPNYGNHSHLCGAPKSIATNSTYGGGKPGPDWEHTSCMLIWGYNPFWTSLCNHGRRIMEAKQRGASLIVIDPRFTPTASKADIWVQQRPGTDGALALGIANVIISEGLHDAEFIRKWTEGFEEFAELARKYPPERVAEITWVPAEIIRKVAVTYASSKPAILWDVNGVEQHTNAVQTLRTLAILSVITGNLDVPGGLILDPEGSERRKTRNLSLRPGSWGEIEQLFSRSIARYIMEYKIFGCRTNDAVCSLETGEPYRIKAMLVEAGDPLLSLPNYQRTRDAFQKLEFLAVHDVFMTRSAEIADLVLPAATFLERTMLVKHMFEGRPRADAGFLGLQDKVVEPLAECRSDLNFLLELGKRMGYQELFPWTGEEDIVNWELEPLGLTAEDLRKNGVIVREYDQRTLYGKYQDFSAGLPSKKIEIYSGIFERYGHDPLPEYHEPAESPLSRPDLTDRYPLICQATIKPGLFTHAQHRTLPFLKEIMPEPWIEINTEKANELGISDGDIVEVESPRGSLKIKARLTRGIDPRVVSMTHGWGQAYAHGVITNLITPDEEECPVSGANGNRSFLCRVSKA